MDPKILCVLFFENKCVKMIILLRWNLGGNYGYVFIGKAHVTDADADFLMLG